MKGCYCNIRVIITSSNEKYCEACMLGVVATIQNCLTGEAINLQTNSGGRVMQKAESFVQDAFVRWIKNLLLKLT
jgi:hypothetical protein